jgi:hypothetical protein
MGVANVFFAGKTPWHREGVKIEGATARGKAKSL